MNNVSEELRESFLRYAFPDKDCTPETADPLMSFLEPADFDDEDDMARQLHIQRDDEGRVTFAKSRKLPTCA